MINVRLVVRKTENIFEPYEDGKSRTAAAIQIAGVGR